jgi:hypothetical protein
MKRRSVLQSLLAIPAIAVAPQSPQQQQINSETPVTPVIPPVETSNTLRRTFAPDQFQALVRLGDLIVPPVDGLPGASEAGAAEFLDFYVGASSQANQDLYRRGLDALNHGQPFAQLSTSDASALLAPLRDAASTDELAPFLRTAKSDILQATFNSQPYIDAVSQTRRPRNGSKYFWYPIS